MTDGEQQGSGTGWRPVPDPTLLTTEQLHREIAALRDSLLDRIARVEEVSNERFSSVDHQLKLVEAQRVEQKADTKEAVEAALTAQKDAVREQTNASERAIGKSEATTTKAIDQLSTNLTTLFDGMRREMGDLKERLTSVEQKEVGGRESATSIYAFGGFIVTLLVIVGTVLAITNG